MCDRWLVGFQAFIADMGRRPSDKYSIERIDNDGPYSPENCRWATMKEQATNKRCNKWIEWRGERMLLQAWAMRVGIHQAVLSYRLNAGWSIDRALTQPILRSKSHGRPVAGRQFPDAIARESAARLRQD